jgi:predicted 2-oxoglutarate/Fe(II)-dependent dioxygenase YbiX
MLPAAHKESDVDKHRLDGDRVFVIRGFLTPEECRSFVAESERAGYEDATISTASGAVMAKHIRDNARLIVDNSSLAAEWWRRAERFLPQHIERWRAVGLNDRFRFYRYEPGQRFAPHFDGYFDRENGERSQLTFMVYLNSDFTGGETKFYNGNRELHIAVQPQSGMALVFVHRQLHEGASVRSGRKYVLRTDVMYASTAENGDA